MPGSIFALQAPDVMRSTAVALNLLGTALGSFLAAGIVQVVGKVTEWLPAESTGAEGLNHSRLDLYYLMLAGLMTLNMACFVPIAAR